MSFNLLRSMMKAYKKWGIKADLKADLNRKYITNTKGIKFGIKYNFEKRRAGGDIMADKDMIRHVIWNIHWKDGYEYK